MVEQINEKEHYIESWRVASCPVATKTADDSCLNNAVLVLHDWLSSSTALMPFMNSLVKALNNSLTFDNWLIFAPDLWQHGVLETLEIDNVNKESKFDAQTMAKQVLDFCIQEMPNNAAACVIGIGLLGSLLIKHLIKILSDNRNQSLSIKKVILLDLNQNGSVYWMPLIDSIELALKEQKLSIVNEACYQERAFRPSEYEHTHQGKVKNLVFKFPWNTRVIRKAIMETDLETQEYIKSVKKEKTGTDVVAMEVNASTLACKDTVNQIVDHFTDCK